MMETIRFGVGLLLMFTAGTLVMGVINEVIGENAAMLFLAFVFVALALAVLRRGGDVYE